MRSDFCRVVPACTLCAILLLVVAGCGRSEKPGFARMHFANESDNAVVFLAIEASEMAASVATNRLAQPLPPHAVYSAVLSRPGNYWVRTETVAKGSIVRRIEGPVRIVNGIQSWSLTREDKAPLYQASATGGLMAYSIAAIR